MGRSGALLAITRCTRLGFTRGAPVVARLRLTSAQARRYRTVLAQMRRGASAREIARGHYMGRHKLAQLRALAEQPAGSTHRRPCPRTPDRGCAGHAQTSGGIHRLDA